MARACMRSSQFAQNMVKLPLLGHQLSLCSKIENIWVIFQENVRQEGIKTR